MVVLGGGATGRLGGGLGREDLGGGGFLVDRFYVVGVLGGRGLGVGFSGVGEFLDFLEREGGLFFEIFRRGGFDIFCV